MQSAPDILYRDQHLVVLWKPAGQFVHPSNEDRRQRSLMQDLRDTLGCYVYPVHRLDRPTSGLIAFALNKQAARSLGEQFAQRLVHKRYQALCRGHLHGAQSCTGELKEERSQRLQSAHTEVTPLQHLTWRSPKLSLRFSLVLAAPKTGRRHQIRRHLRRLNHPILGDAMHGDSRVNRQFDQLLGTRRLMLCATELGFLHPATGFRLEFRRECPIVRMILQHPEVQHTWRSPSV